MKRHKIRNGGYAEYTTRRNRSYSAYIFLDAETDIPEMEVPTTWTDRIHIFGSNEHVPVWFSSVHRANMFLNCDGRKVVLLMVNGKPKGETPSSKGHEKLVVVEPLLPFIDEKTILCKIKEDVNLNI